MNLVNREETIPFQTKDGSTIRELMAPRNATIRHQSLAEATVAPGMATEAHSHPVTEELYYILAGEGEMAVESEVRQVRAGDVIGILPGARHQIRNTGSADLIFLCCCAPAYSHEDTVMCSSLLG